MSNDVKISLKAFALTAVIFIIVYLSGLANFDTNDDLAVIAILRGYFGWQANISPFISPILSMILIKLYDLNYVVPWFGLLQYLTMFIGIYWGLKIILSASWSLMTKVTLIMILLSLYSYLLMRPNFGATSLFSGFMAAIYMTYLNLKGKGFWLSYLLVGVMFALSYMFKTVDVWIILPMIFPALFTFLLSSDTRKKFVVMLIPIAILFIVGVMVNSHALDDYDSVQTVRSTFFSVDFGDMSKSVANLDAAGWDADDYYVSRVWFTHDQVIFGMDAMSRFLYYDVAHNLIPHVIRQMDLLKVAEEAMPFLLMIISGLIIMLDSNRRLFNFKLQKTKYFWIKWLTILSLVAMTGGSVLLFLYRFPPRVYISIFLYAFFVVLLVRPLIMREKKAVFNNMRRGLLGGILCLTILLLVMQIGAYQKVTALKVKYQREADSSVLAMKSMLGDDVMFIEGAGTAATFILTDPFRETLGVNYILVPPGWIINTPTYYDFLQRNNIPVSKMVEYSLDNKNVIYSFYCQGWTPMDSFLRHFNRHYGSKSKIFKFEVVKDFRRGDWEANFVYLKLVSEDKK